MTALARSVVSEHVSDDQAPKTWDERDTSEVCYDNLPFLYDAGPRRCHLNPHPPLPERHGPHRCRPSSLKALTVEEVGVHRFLVGSQVHQQPRASPCLGKQALSATGPWPASTAPPGLGTPPAAPATPPHLIEIHVRTGSLREHLVHRRLHGSSTRPLRATASGRAASTSAIGRAGGMPLCAAGGLLSTVAWPRARRCHGEGGEVSKKANLGPDPARDAAVGCTGPGGPSSHQTGWTGIWLRYTQRSVSWIKAASVMRKKKNLPKLHDRIKEFIDFTQKHKLRKSKTNLECEML